MIILPWCSWSFLLFFCPPSLWYLRFLLRPWAPKKFGITLKCSWRSLNGTLFCRFLFWGGGRSLRGGRWTRGIHTNSGINQYRWNQSQVVSTLWLEIWIACLISLFRRPHIAFVLIMFCGRCCASNIPRIQRILQSGGCVIHGGAVKQTLLILANIGHHRPSISFWDWSLITVLFPDQSLLKEAAHYFSHCFTAGSVDVLGVNNQEWFNCLSLIDHYIRRFIHQPCNVFWANDLMVILWSLGVTGYII